MKYKEQLVTLVRDIVCKKDFTPYCQVIVKNNISQEVISCVHDPKKSRTCLFCAVTEARNIIQDKKETLEEMKVWEIPLYMEVYPLIASLSLKKIGKHHKKLTKAECLAVLDFFEDDPITF